MIGAAARAGHHHAGRELAHLLADRLHGAGVKRELRPHRRRCAGGFAIHVGRLEAARQVLSGAVLAVHVAALSSATKS